MSTELRSTREVRPTGRSSNGHRPAGATPPPALECIGLTVAYGRRPVLDGLELVVPAGRTVAVLGPSGAGKSTLLAAIAGFVVPSAGAIRIVGQSMLAGRRPAPPEARNVGVVFQSYALWPHMTALENVAFPIRRRGTPAAEARASAQALLDRLGIGHLAGRRPAEMSGGEQQRAGVARALARAPDLYLLDEPTAHLDTTLRAVLQEEIAEQRRRDGTAALYATHDVTEALAVADQVALMRGGRIVQVGGPAEVYERPVDAWAARLTGPAAVLAVDAALRGDPAVPAGASAILVRPEWARLVDARDNEERRDNEDGRAGRVRAVLYRGPHTDYRIATDWGELIVRAPGPPRHAAGDAVTWRLRRAWPVPREIADDAAVT